MKKNKISIIVAVYNAEKRITSVVNSFIQQNYDEPYEIILVNDGSTDRSWDVMKKLEKIHKTKIKIYSQKNSGAASARNLGIENARGKYIVITDDDVIFEKNWLKKTIPIIENKKAGFVSSMIKNNLPKNSNYWEKIFFDYAVVSRCADYENKGMMFMCNATRKDILKETGLYDPAFGGAAAGADTDLLLRIIKKGYEIKQSPAVAVHLEERKRFSIGFLIKKPFEWAKALTMVAKKNKFYKITLADKLLIFPIPLFFALTAVILVLFFPLIALAGLLILFSAYFLFRKGMLKSMMQRKIIHLIPLFFILDLVRIMSYNLGSIYYFLKIKKTK